MDPADFTKGAMSAGKSVIGIDRAETPTTQRRRAICNGCDKQKSGTLGKYCDSCQCYIHLKTQVKGEKCPEKKW